MRRSLSQRMEIFLPQYIERLVKVGIDGINVSLDTLQEGKISETDTERFCKRGMERAFFGASI